MKRITIFSIIVILCMITNNINAQWSGKVPETTTTNCGIGFTIQGFPPMHFYSQIINPEGQLHISHIGGIKQSEPSSPNVLPHIVLESNCDGEIFDNIIKTKYLIDANCMGNLLSISTVRNNETLTLLEMNESYINMNTNTNINGTLNLNGNTIANGNITTFGSNIINGANIVNGVTNLNGATTVSGELKIRGHNNLVIQHGDFYITNGSSNQFKVSSDGIVRAREVIVDLAIIPDYVFKDGYKLMPITELEKYVALNKHLPNVKGENEYNKEEGIDIGEMNLKLLEKVEELTLYLIEQNKKIEKLESLVKSK